MTIILQFNQFICILFYEEDIYRASQAVPGHCFAGYIRFVHTICLYRMLVSDNTNNMLNQNTNTSPFTVEERLVAVVWYHEKKHKKVKQVQEEF
jgi:hypothetical protein